MWLAGPVAEAKFQAEDDPDRGKLSYYLDEWLIESEGDPNDGDRMEPELLIQEGKEDLQDYLEDALLFFSLDGVWPAVTAVAQRLVAKKPTKRGRQALSFDVVERIVVRHVPRPWGSRYKLPPLPVRKRPRSWD